MMKRISALLAALLLLGSLAVTVSAQELPNLNRNGSIVFSMDYDGKPLNSGSLSLTRVGDISIENGDSSFVLIQELQGSGLSLTDLNSPELAERLAILAAEKKLPKTTAQIKNGSAGFYNVKPGLYLVTQGADEACEGLAPINPFLISLPRYENGRYVYQLTGDPKVSPEPEPTQPTEPTEPKPTLPPEGDLPQTGQLNWPVPVLACAGVALFLTGWLMSRDKKRETE